MHLQSEFCAHYRFCFPQTVRAFWKEIDEIDLHIDWILRGDDRNDNEYITKKKIMILKIKDYQKLIIC